MKIAHVCIFSAGACGVWMRVKQEALEFTRKGHEVQVFSTNFTKESEEIAQKEEYLGKIKINRFSGVKLGGESFTYWEFKKSLSRFKPDIIITHNYRHIHNHKSLSVGKKTNTPVFLVTHAPFPEGNITRTKFQALITKIYDAFIGRFTINKFEKILAISKWEIPHLLRIGAKKEKIEHIPNGIPKEFFTRKKTAKEENKIIFLGRISTKKKLETLIKAFPLLQDKKIKLEIIGPKDEAYYERLESLVIRLKLTSRIFFSKPVYDLKKKIDKLDSAKIYVLASRVEGMPQGLIEAMSRGKIVIGSNSEAIRDLIKNEKNGYLFEFDNPKDLAKVIDKALKEGSKEILKNARKSVEDFNWEKVYKKIENLLKKAQK